MEMYCLWLIGIFIGIVLLAVLLPTLGPPIGPVHSSGIKARFSHGTELQGNPKAQQPRT